jgi:hypothetical protein
MTNGMLVALRGSFHTCPTPRSLRSADRSTRAQWFLLFARWFVSQLDRLYTRRIVRRMPSIRRTGSVVGAGHSLAAIAVCSFRQLYSHRLSFARPDDHPVVACHPLAAPGVFSPRQLCSHRMSSAHRDGGVLVPPTERSPHVIRSPGRLSGRRMPSARRAGGLLTPPSLQSPLVIRSPR